VVGHVVVATGTDVAVNLSRILLLVGGTGDRLAVLHHHPCLTMIQTFTGINFASQTCPLAHLPLLAVQEVSSFCSSPTGPVTFSRFSHPEDEGSTLFNDVRTNLHYVM